MAKDQIKLNKVYEGRQKERNLYQAKAWIPKDERYMKVFHAFVADLRLQYRKEHPERFK